MNSQTSDIIAMSTGMSPGHAVKTEHKTREQKRGGQKGGRGGGCRKKDREIEELYSGVHMQHKPRDMQKLTYLYLSYIHVDSLGKEKNKVHKQRRQSDGQRCEKKVALRQKKCKIKFHISMAELQMYDNYNRIVTTS